MSILQILTDPQATASTFQWFDKVSMKFISRFLVDLVAVTILVRLIYYRIYKRTDFFLTFFGFNIVIFLITYLLNKVEMSLGAAFGLFAVFSILRYRTEAISTKDMTYLFMVIALGLITAISKGSWDDLSIMAGIVLAIIALLESNILIKREISKSLIYDNIQLITPDKRAEMLADISQRIGEKVHRVDIINFDFLKDSAMLTIYYYD
jgi:Domain of unknown function (DUF4956)